jgi:hypothetical protein
MLADDSDIFKNINPNLTLEIGLVGDTNYTPCKNKENKQSRDTNEITVILFFAIFLVYSIILDPLLLLNCMYQARTVTDF